MVQGVLDDLLRRREAAWLVTVTSVGGIIVWVPRIGDVDRERRVLILRSQIRVQFAIISI